MKVQFVDTISNRLTRSVTVGFAAFALTSNAYAADPNLEQDTSLEPVIDTVLYWGADYAKRDSDSYGYGASIGFITALDGDLGTSGWTISGNFGGGTTEETASDSDFIYGSLLLSYLWVEPTYYFSLGAGIHAAENDETPGGSVTDGNEVGAIFRYGIETTEENAFYFQSYGSYSTAFEQVYAHAKVGFKSETYRYGFEFTTFSDVSDDATHRFGAFLGDIPLGNDLSMVIGAGYQEETQAGLDDGFYATVGFSIPLDLR